MAGAASHRLYNLGCLICSFRIFQKEFREESCFALGHCVILSTPLSLTSHRANTFCLPSPLYQLVEVQPIVATSFFYICAQSEARLSVSFTGGLSCSRAEEDPAALSLLSVGLGCTPGLEISSFRGPTLWWDPEGCPDIIPIFATIVPHRPCHNADDSSAGVGEPAGSRLAPGPLLAEPGVWPPAAERRRGPRRSVWAPRRSAEAQKTLLRNQISFTDPS